MFKTLRICLCLLELRLFKIPLLSQIIKIISIHLLSDNLKIKTDKLEIKTDKLKIKLDKDNFHNK